MPIETLPSSSCRRCKGEVCAVMATISTNRIGKTRGMPGNEKSFSGSTIRYIITDRTDHGDVHSRTPHEQRNRNDTKASSSHPRINDCRKPRASPVSSALDARLVMNHADKALQIFYLTGMYHAHWRSMYFTGAVMDRIPPWQEKIRK